MRANAGTGKFSYLSFDLGILDGTELNTVAGRIVDWFMGAASVKIGDISLGTSVSNYPNPVAKTATFTFSVTEPASVSLTIYDILGKEVARIIDGQLHTTGTYEADFDASKLTNGSYTYVLTAGMQKATGTMLVQK